jgi:ribose 5-phosphate isomerase RpiB
MMKECLGGVVVDQALAWELVRPFLAARFAGREGYRRRLAKVAALETSRTEALPDISLNL